MGWITLRGEWGMVSALSEVALWKHTLAPPEIQDIHERWRRDAVPFGEVIKMRSRLSSSWRIAAG